MSVGQDLPHRIHMGCRSSAASQHQDDSCGSWRMSAVEVQWQSDGDGGAVEVGEGEVQFDAWDGWASCLLVGVFPSQGGQAPGSGYLGSRTERASCASSLRAPSLVPLSSSCPLLPVLFAFA